MKSFLVILAVCVTIGLSGIAFGQVPQTLSYQGILTTSTGGLAPDGSYSLSFALYDSLFAGTLLWSESQPTVTVHKGTFSVTLGSVTPLTAIFNKQLYLEVTAVSGPGISSPVTFAPRSQLTSSPYSLAPWTPSGSNISFVGGNVGIGTSSPTGKLEVNGTIKATDFYGDGSGLTGITGGTGGIANAGSTTVGADTDANGVGEIALQTGKLTRLTVENSGNVIISKNLVVIGDTTMTFSKAGVYRENEILHSGTPVVQVGGTTVSPGFSAWFGSGQNGSIHIKNNSDLKLIDIDGGNASGGNPRLGIGAAAAAAATQSIDADGTARLRGIQPGPTDTLVVTVDNNKVLRTRSISSLGVSSGDPDDDWLRVAGSPPYVHPLSDDYRVGIGTSNLPTAKLEVKTTPGGGGAATFGSSNTTTGSGSVTIGSGNNVSGSPSLAVGLSNNVSGLISFAMGQYHNVSGNKSIALVAMDSVSGENSVAIGANDNVSGSYSLALGTNLQASASGNIVMGFGIGGSTRLSNPIDGSMMVGFDSDIPTFYIGPSSGTGTTGNVGIATTSPISKLHVVGDACITTTLPSTTDTLVLTRNGAGVIHSRSINTLGSDDHDWARTGSNMYPYHITDKIGIGTATPNEQLEITGNFCLPLSTASVGVIKSNGNRFIHNFGSANFFAGVNAGNLALAGAASVGVGVSALQSLTTGNDNTAVGSASLQNNTTGSSNTAVGTDALTLNTTGGANTAVGFFALESTTGNNNTAVGVSALVFNTAGSSNIALGNDAGSNLTNGSNNIYIGNRGGTATESNTIRVGTSGTQTKTFIAGIRGTTTGIANAIPVLIDGSGQLGTISSSRRFKEHIEDMETASEVLYHLRPVRFLYKPEYGGRSDLPQFGLIAEEVAKVAPELVAYDEQGQPYTVYYQFLAPMLLNELQKKDAELKQLQARLETIEKLVKELAVEKKSVGDKSLGELK